MAEYARDDYQNICQKVDFSVHKSIIDIGGSNGVLINYIKQVNPQVHCSLFDLDSIINALSFPDIELISGDFLKAIPQGFDAMILSRVLHDWDNDRVRLILHNCYNSLEEGGSLYIIENCLDLIPIDVSLLSLNMLAICNSQERSSREYIRYATESSFVLVEVKALNTLQSILKFIKI